MNADLYRIIGLVLFGLCTLLPIFWVTVVALFYLTSSLAPQAFARWESNLVLLISLASCLITFAAYRFFFSAIALEPLLGWIPLVAALVGLYASYFFIVGCLSPPPPLPEPPVNASLPSAKYLAWPLPAAVTCVAGGVLGAAVGGGGTRQGFIVALAFNPFLWVAVYCLFKVGQLRCPHCRRARSVRASRNAAVGSPLFCTKCQNWFSKPAA